MILKKIIFNLLDVVGLAFVLYIHLLLKLKATNKINRAVEYV